MKDTSHQSGVSFSLNNIDNDALSEGLKLQSEDILRAAAADITLTEQSFDLHNAEVQVQAHVWWELCKTSLHTP